MIYDRVIATRNGVEHMLYTKLFKPLLFRIDPEEVHDKIILIGQKSSHTPIINKMIKPAFGYHHTALNQTVDGVSYQNPVGLAAGFDKNAQIVALTQLIGFGFEEIGSITGEACAGNDKPRLWRLPKSKSLVVYYGLKNDGAKAIANKLKNIESNTPIGVSIAKTNSLKTASTEAGVSDYIKAYTLMKNVGDYVTINISCPNTFGGQPFTDRKSLNSLLKALAKVKVDKPHYIKLSPDLSPKQLDDIIGLASEYKINGFVTSNLTKIRDNKNIIDDDLPSNGGLSGKVVQELADKQLTYIRKNAGKEFTLIGCGGIFTAADAYYKILHGASLLQMITGMIYQGPQQISEINRGLVKLLKRDGFDNIAQAVGQATD